MSNCQEHQVLASETTATQRRSPHLPITILSRRQTLAPLPTNSPHSPLFLNRQIGPQPASLSVTLLLPVLRCPREDRYRLLESKDHLSPSDLSPQLVGHLLSAWLKTVTPGLLVAGGRGWVGGLVPGSLRIPKSKDAQVPYIKWHSICV